MASDPAPLDLSSATATNPPVTLLVPLDRITDPVRGGAVTIGNFDGVHRGHAALLGRVRRLADRLGGPAVAVAFDPHPAAILRPERTPPKLTWMERRAELLHPLGIDYLVVCGVTRDFLQTSAELFFRQLVVGQLAARGMVEGPNFFFGHGRQGDVAMLRTLCQRDGVVLEIVEPVVRSVAGSEGMVSSTLVRRLIEDGLVERAAELLGHPHRIRGRVVAGDRRGRTIGFPTANLAEIDVLVPRPGVYGGYAHVAGRAYAAAIHLGPRPTFETQPSPQVEAHLLDFSGDLYGCTLQLDLVAKVRDIARFESADNLAEQLRRDVAAVREKLAMSPRP